MTSPFRAVSGVSAFPLTPLVDDGLDADAYAGLIRRLATSGVDSITALGSTGSYAYLDVEERAEVTRIAVENAGEVPVHVGIGALRTSTVQRLAESAQDAGASGVLLSVMTYQALSEDEAFGLFDTVTRDLSVPLIVYDNPGTTHFSFTDELYGRIARLPNVASIKIPGVPAGREAAARRVSEIRAHLPAHVTIGVSGDPSAADGLIGGCDAWYSVIAGTLPEPALRIQRAVRSGRADEAQAESERLAPLWDLFARFGSLRVMAAVAEHYGLAASQSLPAPVRGLAPHAAHEAVVVVERLGLQPS